MAFIKLNPIAQKRLHRFKSVKRGYYSFIILVAITLFSFCAELFINNKALIVSHNGSISFPALPFGSSVKGTDIGEPYAYEINYREVGEKWKKAESDSWILMPLIPYSATEHLSIDQVELIIEGDKLKEALNKDLAAIKASGVTGDELNKKINARQNEYELADKVIRDQMFHPLAPDASSKHFLGTGPNGRDILAVLVYGYRIAICFSLGLLICNYTIGVSIGCLMGYVGGWFDLLFQRLIEMLSRIPFLFMIMIMSTIWGQNFWVLLGLMVFFGWMRITWQMRTATYREKERDYVMAVRSLGATNLRILFIHIIPSTIALLVTFIPFSISGGIIGLTSLDYLGFGLPPSSPSWGDLMKQGTENMDSPWIVLSVVVSLIVILFMVNMVGEAIREAYDPKKHTIYE